MGQPRDRAGTEGVAASRPVPFALSIPIVELARRLQQQIGGASATAAAGEPGRRGQAGQDGAATPAPSVVQHYDQREEVHITVNGLYGGRAGLNHLERELKQAAVRNRSKLIR